MRRSAKLRRPTARWNTKWLQPLKRYILLSSSPLIRKKYLNDAFFRTRNLLRPMWAKKPAAVSRYRPAVTGTQVLNRSLQCRSSNVATQSIPTTTTARRTVAQPSSGCWSGLLSTASWSTCIVLPWPHRDICPSQHHQSGR